ncbi:MAG: endolytic transglycosylase MltG [Clostridiales bacterium]|nr:endolytic transglycosylase MltG [Clostridiales bacterium]
MGKKTVKIIIAVIITLAVIAVGAFLYNKISSDINGGDKSNGKEYTLVIESKDFQYEISKKLANNGIVIDDSLWSLWMDSHYPNFTYINGEYYLNSNMSYEEIAQKLQNPDISHKIVSVAIPEGYNVFDIAKTMEENGICSKEDFYSAVSTTEGYDYSWLSDFPENRNNIGFILEGFLFPATYDLGLNTPAEDVVDTMLAAFNNRLSDDMINYCSENNISLYEFITLCSIVQEEALTESSAENIASVLVNRLKNGTKLQCDVTYFYAASLRDYGFSQDVYNAYYTYRCPALPAGPIANSGMEIVNAVINHPDTNYLYFFSDLNGEFHFASTGAEFERLKQQYPWQKDDKGDN